METQDFLLAERFFVLAIALGRALGAAAGFAGARLLADAFAPFAASRPGIRLSAAARTAADGTGDAGPGPFPGNGGRVPFLGNVDAVSSAAGALGAALAFFRPHLPKVRAGAAASRVWHSSKVRLFGSLP